MQRLECVPITGEGSLLKANGEAEPSGSEHIRQTVGTVVFLRTSRVCLCVLHVCVLAVARVREEGFFYAAVSVGRMSKIAQERYHNRYMRGLCFISLLLYAFFVSPHFFGSCQPLYSVTLLCCAVSPSLPLLILVCSSQYNLVCPSSRCRLRERFVNESE